ncbi:MAG: hypothetical protein QOD77_260 [Thermoplasmata archaeon]|jgi:hypothetical protein|nr:hypothetical protein [Thermoplasmata archaeon]
MGRIAAVFALLLLPAAAAFTAIDGAGSPHGIITRAAAEQVGWTDPDELLDAVFEPDLDDSELEPHADHIRRMDATSDYRPGHHCDRVPPTDDATAFEEAARYVREQRARLAHEAYEGSPDDALEALGRALHAVQDCVSHSNAVDLAPAHQAALLEALLGNGSTAAPAGLRLTGFLPNTDEPGRPPGDPYPHDAYAKDEPGGNAESDLPSANGTKYDAAHRLALEASVRLLQDTKARLAPEQWQDLMEADHEENEIGRVLPAPMAGMAVAVAAVLARRRMQ